MLLLLARLQGQADGTQQVLEVEASLARLLCCCLLLLLACLGSAGHGLRSATGGRASVGRLTVSPASVAQLELHQAQVCKIW